MEECQQYVSYKAVYGLKTLYFKIENYDECNNENSFSISEPVIDIAGKSYQHNESRIISNINQLVRNYPKLEQLIDNLHIFMCPKPSTDTANACACKHYILYYARSTQIPTCMTDYITAHEMGHVIQQSFCPEYRRNKKFKEYLKIRNAPTFIDSEDNEEKFVYIDGRYVNSEAHAQYEKYHSDWDTSPLEWFAEDFRYLFGINKGEPFWGLPIEPPNEKIKEFLLNLNE